MTRSSFASTAELEVMAADSEPSAESEQSADSQPSADREPTADRDRDQNTAAGGVPRRRRRRTDECVLVHGLCAAAIALTPVRVLSTTVVAAVHACLFGLCNGWSKIRLIIATVLTKTVGGPRWPEPDRSGFASDQLSPHNRSGSTRDQQSPHNRSGSTRDQQSPHDRSGSTRDQQSPHDRFTDDQQFLDRYRSDRRPHCKSTARTNASDPAAGSVWTPLLQVAGRGLRSIFYRRGRGHSTRRRRGRAAMEAYETVAAGPSTVADDNYRGTSDQRPQYRYAIDEQHYYSPSSYLYT